jgi:hypothetical protein
MTDIALLITVTGVVAVALAVDIAALLTWISRRWR